jgi:hypothetical protein
MRARRIPPGLLCGDGPLQVTAPALSQLRGDPLSVANNPAVGFALVAANALAVQFAGRARSPAKEFGPL